MIFYLLAFGASFFMAWTIGADSASPSLGPVVSSRTLGVLRSSLLVGLSALVGAITQGSHIAKTIGSGLVIGTRFDPVQSSLVLLIAALIIAFGIWRHYPIPAAFTLVGATLGVGIGVGGNPNLAQLVKVISYWLLLPFLAAGIGFLVSKLLISLIKEDSTLSKALQPLLILFGIYTAYTAGANGVGLAVGPLSGFLNLNIGWLLALGGTGMLLGAWTGSPKIIDAVAHSYVDIGPRRSIAALVGTSLLAQVGALLGIPISFNTAILGAIIGSGLASRTGKLGTNKISLTAGGWILSLFSSFGIGYAVAKLIT